MDNREGTGTDDLGYAVFLETATVWRSIGGRVVMTGECVMMVDDSERSMRQYQYSGRVSSSSLMQVTARL